MNIHKIAKTVLSTIAITLVLIFGTSFENNIHNYYLRSVTSYTVKLTNDAGNSGATGFVVKGASGKKYIMTNSHVCGLADESGTIYAHYQGERFPVKVFKKYVWNDLCAIESHRPLGKAASIASYVTNGENTWVIGHPLLEPKSVAVGELSGTAIVPIATGMNVKPEDCAGPTYHLYDTAGTIYALMGIQNICVRTLEAQGSTMAILPGNSGSPAVNEYGNVVAVAFAGYEGGVRSYFVPLADLKDFLGEL